MSLIIKLVLLLLASVCHAEIIGNGTAALLAILNSNVMNQNNRNTWVNVAINKFKFNFEKNLLPAQIPEAQLYTYTSGEPAHIQSWQPAQHLKYISFSHDTPQHINFETLLTNGNSMFKGKQGGVYTILIGGHSIDPANTLSKVESLANELKLKQVKINIVEFPQITQNREFALGLFNKSVSITGGKLTSITEQGKSFGTALSLIHAMDSEVKLYRIIAEKVFDDLSTKAVDMEFDVDSSLMNAKLRAYFIQSGGDSFTGNSVQLHPPKGQAQCTLLDQVPNYEIDGLATKINKQEFIGKWHFVAKTIQTSESIIGIVEVVV